MKVLHIIPSLSSKDGGPSFAMPLIARGLQCAGVTVDVATTIAAKDAELLNGGLAGPLTRDGVSYFYFPRQSEFYKISFPLFRKVQGSRCL